MYCTQCGQGNNDEAKFCNSCGVDLRHQTSPEQKTDNDQLDDSLTSLDLDIPEEYFAIGALYANRYEILNEGNVGGMGSVYKCKDTRLNDIVALKIIHPRLLNSKNALSRFRQEAALSRELHHENIVKVFNLEEWEGMEYFTMEWIEGLTLREVIAQRKKNDKPFTLNEANIIIRQLSEALMYAHEYTVHRDVKPENILLEGTRDQGIGVSEKTRIKLTDFGIAKMLSPSQFTSTNIHMGTPYYMAPEQKVDAGSVDKRADIYSLGVILFELITLENTIGPHTPSQLNHGITSEIDRVYKKAVAVKRDLRYSEIGQFMESFSEVLIVENENIKKRKKFRELAQKHSVMPSDEDDKLAGSSDKSSMDDKSHSGFSQESDYRDKIRRQQAAEGEKELRNKEEERMVRASRNINNAYIVLIIIVVIMISALLIPLYFYSGSN